MEQYRNSDILILQLVSRKFIILEASWELSKYSQIWKGSWEIFTLLMSWVISMNTLPWSTLHISNIFPSAVSMLSFPKDICSHIHSWEGSLWTRTLLRHQCWETLTLTKPCFPKIAYIYFKRHLYFIQTIKNQDKTRMCHVQNHVPLHPVKTE